jgi:hypothetical protein
MEQKNDDDTALDPAAMLALMQREQAEIPRRLARQIPWILLAWGVAWVCGYGMLWLIDGARPLIAVPLPVSVAVFIAVLVAAIVVSAVIGARAQRGIRATPAAAFTGTVYGITAGASFVAMYIFAAGLAANGMGRELQSIFFPTAMGIVIAILYLIAGAIWHAIPAIIMGGGILSVSLIAPFFGYPNHYLFFALAGGAVFLGGALSVALYVRGRR